MNEDMKNFMSEMLNGMPAELKEVLRKAVYERSDAMVSDPEIRKQKRAEIEAMGDPDMLKGFDSACHMYDLNVQAVQLLGNIKHMLEEFDPENLSSADLKSNISLIKRLQFTLVLGLENMDTLMSETMEDNDENRDGDTSGRGT